MEKCEDLKGEAYEKCITLKDKVKSKFSSGGGSSDSYTFQDALQAIAGGFIVILTVYAFRAGDPLPFVNPFILIGVTLLLSYILYTGTKNKFGDYAVIHIILDYLVVYGLCIVLAFMLGLITTFEVFSSSIIVPSWIGFTSAVIFDMYDIKNPITKSDYWARK